MSGEDIKPLAKKADRYTNKYKAVLNDLRRKFHAEDGIDLPDRVLTKKGHEVDPDIIDAGMIPSEASFEDFVRDELEGVGIKGMRSDDFEKINLIMTEFKNRLMTINSIANDVNVDDVLAEMLPRDRTQFYKRYDMEKILEALKRAKSKFDLYMKRVQSDLKIDDL